MSISRFPLPPVVAGVAMQTERPGIWRISAASVHTDAPIRNAKSGVKAASASFDQFQPSLHLDTLSCCTNGHGSAIIRSAMSASENHPDSPCIGLCIVEDEICSGCGRALEEIAEWPAATAARKREIIARLEGAKSSQTSRVKAQWGT